MSKKKIVKCLCLNVPNGKIVEMFESKEMPCLTELTAMILDYEDHCARCRGVNVKRVHEVENFILLDVENFYQAKDVYAESSDILLEIEFKNYKLSLSGIVCFSPGHYFTYLYCSDKKTWELRDDLYHECHEKKVLKRLKISLLMYIRKDE